MGGLRALSGSVRMRTSEEPRPRETGHAAHSEGADVKQWDLRVFPSVLVSSRAFEDDGMRSSLVGADRITLAALNAYAERRFGAAWALSAASSFQRIEAEGPAGTTSFSDLGDSFLSARHGRALPFVNLSIAATVKIPGPYLDSAVTISKQVHAEGRVILAGQGTRVTLAGGAGYKLRLGDAEDETTAYAAVPVRLARALTITGTVAAGVPIGAGAVAKNVVIPGLSLEWATAPVQSPGATSAPCTAEPSPMPTSSRSAAA